MEILIPVLIAILSYKIKLIDDRKSENLKRFKNYLRRHPANRKEHDLGEFDEWLDKDIQYQLMGEYEAAAGIEDEGRKQAILDYYKDFCDNEGSRLTLVLFVFINLIIFISILIGFIKESNLWIYATPILSVILSLMQPVSNVFNNRIVNVSNSLVSKEIYRCAEERIKSDITRMRLKGRVLNIKC